MTLLNVLENNSVIQSQELLKATRILKEDGDLREDFLWGFVQAYSKSRSPNVDHFFDLLHEEGFFNRILESPQEGKPLFESINNNVGGHTVKDMTSANKEKYTKALLETTFDLNLKAENEAFLLVVHFYEVTAFKMHQLNIINFGYYLQSTINIYIYNSRNRTSRTGTSTDIFK